MIDLKQKLILASASPRRKDILEMVGLDFEVIPSLYVEPSHSDHLVEAALFAQDVALGKGQEVFDRYENKHLVLSADTIGLIDDIVLEKPIDREDAKRMLKLMSGKTHAVLTAVALFIPGKAEPLLKTVTTQVSFRDLSGEEIEIYLDQEEYSDKAAAYAIQGKAAVFVERIEGEYFNVVGLPIVTVWEMLKESQQ
jgi:septum formation protein